jgi:hypothetical protein
MFVKRCVVIVIQYDEVDVGEEKDDFGSSDGEVEKARLSARPFPFY